jgi:AraC family transcriptional regulator, arabinose operon regulatory protein
LFGWTSDYFSRRFRRHFGVPPRTWLTQERVRRAKVLLLESELSIQQVARRVGFDNQRFFATQFRRLNGESPSKYRQSH